MLKLRNNFFAVLAICFVLSSFVSCVSTSSANLKDFGFAGDWCLTAVKSEGATVSIPKNVTPSLTVDVKGKGKYTVSGNAGVNSFTGEVSIDGALYIGESFATTMMAGEVAAEKVERAYLSVLENADIILLDTENGVLEIKSGDGKSFAQFERFSLLDDEWRLNSYNDGNAVVSLDRKLEAPELIFSTDTRIAGFSGVNRIMGEYVTNDKSRELQIFNLVTTKMAAASEEAAGLETTFLKLLNETKSYVWSGNSLSLKADDGSTLLVFSK